MSEEFRNLLSLFPSGEDNYNVAVNLAQHYQDDIKKEFGVDLLTFLAVLDFYKFHFNYLFLEGELKKILSFEQSMLHLNSDPNFDSNDIYTHFVENDNNGWLLKSKVTFLNGTITKRESTIERTPTYNPRFLIP